MLYFLFVDFKYFWFRMNLKRRRDDDTARFNATLMSYFFLFYFALCFSLLLDLFLHTGFLTAFHFMIPSEDPAKRKLYAGTIVFGFIGLYRFVHYTFFKGKETSFQKSFNRYVAEEVELSRRKKTGIIIFIVLTLLSPLIILGIYQLSLML